MAFKLPQNDTNAKRAGELSNARNTWVYNHKYGFPMGTKRDSLNADWTKMVLKALREARSNLDAILEKTGWQPTNKVPTLNPIDLLGGLIKDKDIPDLFDIFLTETGPIKGGGRPTSLEDYQQVFQKVEKTYSVERFMDDEHFAHTFVAGAHANAFGLMRSIPSNFPITNEIFRKTKEFANDDLAYAIAAGRVYIADYKEMNGLTDGVHPLQKKYIYKPIVAFALPVGGKQMMPFAIQCSQMPSDESPIFTPADSWAWQMAKGTAWVAHHVYHELISHLGTTHLLMEPMVLASRRQLHGSHPIYNLLAPHFEGTLTINSLADTSLIQENQYVDRLVGSGIKSNFEFLSKGRLNYSFTENMLPTRLKNKGLMSLKRLPVYHFRDDGILIWNATRSWVSRYIDRHYSSDMDVKADFELQAWAQEISSDKGGCVKDFAAIGGIDNKDQLIDACTMILFTAGPQHAAVNFPQLTDMSFLPGGPLAGYRSAPEHNRMTQQDYLDFLPPMDIAIKQWQIMHFLGSIHHTRFGHYPDSLTSDPVIKAASDKFKADLQRIEGIISDRNRDRLSYDVLMPSKIPQSINI